MRLAGYWRLESKSKRGWGYGPVKKVAASPKTRPIGSTRSSSFWIQLFFCWLFEMVVR